MRIRDFVSDEEIIKHAQATTVDFDIYMKDSMALCHKMYDAGISKEKTMYLCAVVTLLDSLFDKKFPDKGVQK